MFGMQKLIRNRINVRTFLGKMFEVAAQNRNEVKRVKTTVI